MHSIVQVPLDPAPRLVRGRDDPRPRGGELGPAPLELALAFAQVTEHQQRVQPVGQPPSDLMEQPLLVRCPDPRARALVQPERVGLVYLRVNGHGDDGLDAETLRQPWRKRRSLTRDRSAPDRLAASRLRETPATSGSFGMSAPVPRGADVFRPGALRWHPKGVDCRITGIKQPRPIASEDLQHGIENIAHHLLEVAGPLDGAVDRVHAFEEPQLRPVFFLGTPALGHVHDGGHQFLELAATR